MEPLKLDNTVDPVSALLALGDVIDGKRNLVIESSGSTGTPKPIELSGAQLMQNAIASAERLGGHGQWLLALPISFVAGAMVLVRSLVSELQPVVLNTNVPFTAEGFARTAGFMSAESRYTSLVPAQLERLASELDQVPGLLQVLKRFDAILIGGQKPRSQTIERLRAMGINLVVTYGMAETGGGVIYDGLPLTGVEVAIEDDGRIRIGDLVTNDLGEFVDGKLVVSGRADRVIISGGHKLALEAVEDWTHEQRGVLDAAAVSVTHPQFGEAFVCFFILASGGSLDTSRAALALGIVAKSGTWKQLEQLPTLSNGKPDLQFLTVMANQLGETFE